MRRARRVFTQVVTIHQHFRVGVVGCGIGGSLFFEHLAAMLEEIDEQAVTEIEILIFNPEHSIGTGIPFGPDLPCATINTSYRRLNSLGKSSTLFTDWLAETNRLASQLNSFPIPRSFYGAYSRSKLRNAVQLIEKSIRVRWVKERVRAMWSIAPDKIQIATESGEQFLVNASILAVGNWSPPKIPGARTCYPLERQIQSISPASGPETLIVGTGLSAVDAAITLAEQGIACTMASPSGRLPWVQIVEEAESPFPKHLTISAVKELDAEGGLTADAALGLIVRECEEYGVDLNAVLAGQHYDQHWSEPREDRRHNAAYTVLSTANAALNLIFQRLSYEQRQVFELALNGNWRRFRFRIPLSRWKQLKNFILVGLVQLDTLSPVERNPSALASYSSVIDARGQSALIQNSTFLTNVFRENGLKCDYKGRGLWDPSTGLLISSRKNSSPKIYGIGCVTAGSNLITSALDVIDIQANLVARSIFGQLTCTVPKFKKR